MLKIEPWTFHEKHACFVIDLFIFSNFGSHFYLLLEWFLVWGQMLLNLFLPEIWLSSLPWKDLSVGTEVKKVLFSLWQHEIGKESSDWEWASWLSIALHLHPTGSRDLSNANGTFSVKLCSLAPITLWLDRFDIWAVN